MMRKRSIILCMCIWCVGLTVRAQEVTSQKEERALHVTQDSTVVEVLQKADTISVPEAIIPKAFKPNPTHAVLYGLIPGMGQIYNRKYWKLPIVYGGLMACTYAITWNNVNFRDYSTAYLDIMTDMEHPNDPDKWNESWQNLIPAGTDPVDYVNNKNFQDAIKRKKDYYRKYRDMSILITIGVYALSLVDAYVDAQLFDFDISDDLSLRVAPDIQPVNKHAKSSYGFNCCLTF